MSDIEEIKEKIDIVEFINERVPLKKTGRNFTALCPFHSEKTPSFVVSPERQIWYCFGACNEGGDAFKFLMKWENIDFPEALKELARKTGVKLTRVNIEDQSWKAREKLYEINHLASEYYHFLLTKHKIGEKARAYLKERGISEKTIKTFMLGYAPNGWRNLFSFLKKRGYRPEDMEKAGLVIKTQEGNFYDRFRGRLIFTLSDVRANAVGFSGRILNREAKEAKYINSPETSVYHKSKNLFGLNITKEEVRKKNQIIICEGEFDVLSSFQQGIGNIAAVKGTALTFDQLRLIKRYCEEIVFAFDMDLAGDFAARRAIEMAETFGFDIKVVQLPKGKDIDEALKENAPETKKAVANALPLYDFILDSALFRHPKKDAFTKKKITAEVVPFFSKIDNPIVRNHYVKKLAKTLEIDEEAVNEELNKVRRKTDTAKPAPPADNQKAAKTMTRQESLENILLNFVLQSKKFKENLKIVIDQIKIQDIQTSSVRKIFELLAGWKSDDLKNFDKILPKELHEVYNRACLQEVSGGKTFQPEFLKVLFEVKKSLLKKRLNKIAVKIKEAEEENLKDLNQEFKEILEEIRNLDKKKK